MQTFIKPNLKIKGVPIILKMSEKHGLSSQSKASENVVHETSLVNYTLHYWGWGVPTGTELKEFEL